MKAMNAPEWGLAWPVLRFNFRGTGLSEGDHDGKEEWLDVVAALKWLESEFALPIVLGGFSFGAAMALKACAETGTRVQAVAALGLPAHAEGRIYRYSFLKDLNLPKLFLSGDQDRYATSAELEAIAAAAPEPRTLVLIPGADHFFTGQLQPMQTALANWLKEQAP
jgi:hypothetical protein